MIYFILKILISGIIIATVSTVGISHPRLGAVVGVLPIVTILTFLILIFAENADRAVLVNLSSSICIMSLATILYFPLLYLLFRYTEISSTLVIFIALVPIIIAHSIMFTLLK